MWDNVRQPLLVLITESVSSLNGPPPKPLRSSRCCAVGDQILVGDSIRSFVEIFNVILYSWPYAKFPDMSGLITVFTDIHLTARNIFIHFSKCYETLTDTIENLLSSLSKEKLSLVLCIVLINGYWTFVQQPKSGLLINWGISEPAKRDNLHPNHRGTRLLTKKHRPPFEGPTMIWENCAPVVYWLYPNPIPTCLLKVVEHNQSHFITQKLYTGQPTTKLSKWDGILKLDLLKLRSLPGQAVLQS